MTNNAQNEKYLNMVACLMQARQDAEKRVVVARKAHDDAQSELHNIMVAISCNVVPDEICSVLAGLDLVKNSPWPNIEMMKEYRRTMKCNLSDARDTVNAWLARNPQVFWDDPSVKKA